MNFNFLHARVRKCPQQRGTLKEIAWWAGKKAQWLEHFQMFLGRIQIWYPAPEGQ